MKAIRSRIIETVLPYFQQGKMTQDEFIYHLEGLMTRFDEFCVDDEYEVENE